MHQNVEFLCCTVQMIAGCTITSNTVFYLDNEEMICGLLHMFAIAGPDKLGVGEPIGITAQAHVLPLVNSIVIMVRRKDRSI